MLSLLAVLAAGALGAWWQRGRAQAVPDPAVDQVQCLSYAPFRRPGETPFDPAARVDEARIEADLRLLASRTRCVRTYSVQQGLDAVPRVARRLGMRVLLGAWIGRDRVENEAELASAIALAREHADVVRALIVGNEVLLRGELPASELNAHLQRARREAPPAVPVTYADVWEFWLRHRALADSVSFVTVHILPYWEDEPVGVDRAVAHVLDIRRLVQQAFAGREVLIGETGWPSAGRARRDAVPGRVEQARFIREFVSAAQAQGLRYNLIEAFDQPWKRWLEGAMGGTWGLLDSAGRLKFPWRGPVEQDPDWIAGPIAAGMGALAFGALAIARGRYRRALAVHVLAGAAIGAVLALQWRYMLQWNRGTIEWSASLVYTLLAGWLGWVTADRLAPAGLEAKVAPRCDPPGIAHALSGSMRVQALTDTAWLTGVLRFAFLFGAATMTVLLAFDARYRGFAWPLYAVPAACAVLGALAGDRAPPDAREERLLAGVIAIGSVAVIAIERPVNPQLWPWLLTVGLVAGWAVGLGRSTRPAGSRHEATAPSSSPTAAGSKQ